jgi:hypothetical protein
MSAQARPTTTADGDMGIERKRSVIPFAASVVTAIIVASMPNAIVMANMPGSRNSRYSPPPGITIPPPKR